MVTTELVAAITASTLVTDLTAVMTALVTLILGVIGAIAIFVLVTKGIRKIAGMVSSAGSKL